MTADHAYLEELACRIAESTGDELVGVCVGGSFALGDYEPGRSDLDVAAVVESRRPPLRERGNVGVEPAAGAWAAEQLPDAALVEDALEARTSGLPVDPARARAFVQLTLDRLGD